MSRSERALGRRQFLKTSLAGLGGLALAGLARRAHAQEPATGAAGDAPPPEAPAPGAPAAGEALIFDAHEPRLLTDKGNVRDDYLLGVVRRLLMKMTGTRQMEDAWRQYFSETDVIGIKFDPVAARELRTSTAMARMLVGSLLDAGFSPEKIMLIDSPIHVVEYGTLPEPFGYEPKGVEIGEKQQTHFARALSGVTAVLNVPFIKDHHRLGLSCGIVNLVLGLVNNPGAFVEGHGDPGVARLLARQEVRKKHRLTIVNAIRGIYDGGPRPQEGKVWNECCILGGSDVVAADRVALDLLDAARISRGLKSLTDAARPPKYLDAAARMGLGVAKLQKIRIRRVSF